MVVLQLALSCVPIWIGVHYTLDVDMSVALNYTAAYYSLSIGIVVREGDVIFRCICSDGEV